MYYFKSKGREQAFERDFSLRSTCQTQSQSLRSKREKGEWSSGSVTLVHSSPIQLLWQKVHFPLAQTSTWEEVPSRSFSGMTLAYLETVSAEQIRAVPWGYLPQPLTCRFCPPLTSLLTLNVFHMRSHVLCDFGTRNSQESPNSYPQLHSPSELCLPLSTELLHPHVP